jgi:hypothetical protein
MWQGRRWLAGSRASNTSGSASVGDSVVTVSVICVVVIGVLAMITYTVHMVKPRHVRFRAMLGRLASVDFEAHRDEAVTHDASSTALPPGRVSTDASRPPVAPYTTSVDASHRDGSRRRGHLMAAVGTDHRADPGPIADPVPGRAAPGLRTPSGGYHHR